MITNYILNLLNYDMIWLYLWYDMIWLWYDMIKYDYDSYHLLSEGIILYKEVGIWILSIHWTILFFVIFRCSPKLKTKLVEPP